MEAAAKGQQSPLVGTRTYTNQFHVHHKEAFPQPMLQHPWEGCFLKHTALSAQGTKCCVVVFCPSSARMRALKRFPGWQALLLLPVAHVRSFEEQELN